MQQPAAVAIAEQLKAAPTKTEQLRLLLRVRASLLKVRCRAVTHGNQGKLVLQSTHISTSCSACGRGVGSRCGVCAEGHNTDVLYCMG